MIADRRQALAARRGHAAAPALFLLLPILLAYAGNSHAWVAPPEGLRMEALAEITLNDGRRAVALNSNNMGDSPFDGARLSVFVHGSAAKGLGFVGQLLFTDALPMRTTGAYAVYSPFEGKDISLLAGKIPWMIGTYAPRTYADEKPLIGTPLMYQYHSSLRPDLLPADADALVAAAGTGQDSPRGLPVVYDACWDLGAMVSATAGVIEIAGGFVHGSPSLQSKGSDGNPGKSILGRIGVVPMPALRCGVSGSLGPYLPASAEPAIPPGRGLGDYAQRLGMADLQIMLGHLELHSEGFVNSWETPTVGDLRLRGYYAELRYNFSFGGFVAGRHESLRFDDVRLSSGEIRPWDNPRDRGEAGFGVRLTRESTLKLVMQRNSEFVPSGPARHVDLYALQFAVRF